jgi:peptidoglycan/LPS O-acetylase OafA/YrhL
LAVEEQFYLIWPFTVMFASEEALLGLCAAGLAVALPLRIYLLHHVFGDLWAEMIITTARMDGLFVGSVYAILLYRFKKIPLSLIMLSAFAGIAILGWIVVFHFKGEFWGSGPYMRTFGVTAVALLAGSLIGFSQYRLRPLHGFLSSGPLRFFGRYSYGIYVFHIPIFVVASHLYASNHGLLDPVGLMGMPLPVPTAILFILGINGLSILVAVLSFQFVESKILMLKDRFKPKWAAVEAVR